jgi:carbon-monoxide dehydrogenase medium subunit
MKPARFEYRAPNTLEEAVALLAADPEAKPIAGGQSLMPVLNFRLAAPTMLVDLRRVGGLDKVVIGADGVRLGAKVRWRDIEADRRLAIAHPLLQEAVAHVAHYQIRNRGTVGGSLAHADPAAELPGIAVTCDGEIRVVGPAGQRTISADEFFIGPLSTALRPDELITELRLPMWPAERAGPSASSPAGTAISPWPGWRCSMTWTRTDAPTMRMSGLSGRAAGPIGSAPSRQH